MSTGIHYSLGLDAGPLQRGFALARGAVSGFAGAIGRIGSITGLVGGLGLAGAAVVGFKNAITGAADMESTETAFQTMLGSMRNAKGLLSELKDFAKATPFEFPELADAAKKLLAFGSTSKGIVPELKMIGDVASGVGVSVGELAEIYGKNRVQGKLMAEDVNQLTGRGIPIIQEFAKQFGVGTAEVRGLVEAGQVGFPALRTAMQSLTAEGGRFFGMTEKQSRTANGLWSTLKDSIGEVLRSFGGPVLVELKQTLTDAIALAGGLVTKAKEWGDHLATALAVVRELAKGGKLGEALGAGLQLGLAKAINFAAKGLAGALSASIVGVIGLLKEAINLIFDANTWQGVFDGLTTVGKGFAEAIGEAIRAEIPEMLRTTKDFGSIHDRRAGLTPPPAAPKPGDTLQKAMDVFTASFGKMGNVVNEGPLKAQLFGLLDPVTALVLAARDKTAAAAAELAAAEPDVPEPEPAEGGSAPRKKTSSRSASDPLTSIGLFIGAGGPAGDKHQRDTAKNTSDTVKNLKLILEETKARKSDSATF